MDQRPRVLPERTPTPGAGAHAPVRPRHRGRPHATAKSGGGRNRPPAAGGTQADTTAGTDPPAASPPGRTWHPRTPDSPSRARRREGRTRPPCRTSPSGHSHVTGHEVERHPKAVTARPRGRRGALGRARKPDGRDGLDLSLQASTRSRKGNEPGGRNGGDEEPGADPPPGPLNARGRQRDVGPPRQARGAPPPPPPPPPQEGRGARGGAPPSPQAARPRTVTRPLQQLPRQAAAPASLPNRPPAARRYAREPQGAPLRPRPDWSAQTETGAV